MKEGTNAPGPARADDATPRAWDEGIATGVDSVDAEHRLQVSLLKALDELVQRGAEAELVSRTIAQLVDFTRVHFLSEELMMRLYAYPGHETHELEHGRLVEQVEAVRRRLEAGERRSALGETAGLRTWLADHIRSMDHAFALWCAKHGVHPR